MKRKKGAGDEYQLQLKYHVTIAYRQDYTLPLGDADKTNFGNSWVS